jgi:TolA-binding protein
LEKHPHSPLAAKGRYARGLARQQLKDFRTASADFEEFLKSRPEGADESDARYALGVCLANMNKPAEAAQALESLLADDPQYAAGDKALYELAWARKAEGKEPLAAAAFAQLAQKHPQSAFAAESLFHVGEFNYAKDDYRAAAKAYQASAQLADAAKAAELAEKAAHKLGWAHFRLDDFAAAQQAFTRQRNAHPAGPLAADAAFMEGESLFKQKKYAEALAAFQQAKQPTSDEFAALALLHGGQAAGQLKDWKTSLQLLERCTREFPQSDRAAEALYEQAWARQNLGQIDEALRLYEETTAKTNREPAARARFMIGEIQFERKDHKEAIKNFFKTAYGYGYPQWQAYALYEAARCFEALEKPDQAKKSYQEVLDKFPSSDQAAAAKQRLGQLSGPR